MKFKLKHIPNVLTISRMILLPIIIFFIFVNIDLFSYSYNILGIKVNFTLNITIAGILFAIASFTDALDGLLARKYNWISLFGKKWDPISDKFLINSVIIAFAIKGYIPYFVPMIFILRDIIVDSYRASVIKDNIDISSNIFGKLKTIFQMLGILFIFFVSNNNNINENFFLSNNWEYYIIQNLLIFISIILSFFSGYIYVKKKV